MIQNFEFTHPHFLWLLLIVPPIVLWLYLKRDASNPNLSIPDTRRLDSESSFIVRLKPLLNIIRILAIVLLVLALSRPRKTTLSTVSKTNKGIDIIMAVDISASMLAKDLKPNRLEALKKVATTFVNQRSNDRIGIVAYAGESFTKTPLTTDKRIIRNSIENLKWGDLEGGTAIGMGLGSSINRLKNSKAKSKVVILLTDGVNNSGFVDPITATELAVGLGIKVYTIALGTNGTAPTPAFIDQISGKIEYRQAKVEIDEKLLKKIAFDTGGKYFRATNNNKLQSIYEEINKLEKTEIEEFRYYNYHDFYRILVLLAGAILLIEFLLRNTLYRSFI